MRSIAPGLTRSIDNNCLHIRLGSSRYLKPTWMLSPAEPRGSINVRTAESARSSFTRLRRVVRAKTILSCAAAKHPLRNKSRLYFPSPWCPARALGGNTLKKEMTNGQETDHPCVEGSGV